MLRQFAQFVLQLVDFCKQSTAYVTGQLRDIIIYASCNDTNIIQLFATWTFSIFV